VFLANNEFFFVNEEMSEEEKIEPPRKKARILRPTDKMRPFIQSTSCCSCQEENVPYLLLVGCSNGHLICHLCTRMFVSSKITMNQFPRNFPGKLSSLGTLECPVCREHVNGVTNLFVLEEINVEEHKSPVNTKGSSPESRSQGLSPESRPQGSCPESRPQGSYSCPYAELIHKDVINTIKCDKMMTLNDLHKHLIQYHNQTIKCPNCSQWLCDGEKNMEDLLQFHIMKNCQQIKCHGCDRTGNMLNMYMHSIIGRDNSCNTAKQMFSSFGQQLSECFYVFQSSENITQLATLMMTWLVQYLYQRVIGTDIGIDVFDRSFARIFYAFILQAFCKIHAPLIQSDMITLINKILKLSKGLESSEYEEDILLMTSEFAKINNQRLDRISRLPFCYRILIMTLSDFNYAKKIANNYPRNITPVEQSEISKLIELYETIIPDESPVITFQLNAT